ncbi:hypothetical protein [Planctomycetes bacterium K23_9]|uniref:DUF695 domain-containing protein n=1 Tax=Stieleria marina TaxID=1930275 RepID=A0A517NVV2_9BACT|nr:hypothetical protein K239x_32430 [Planctomycetes bacterium K23_9]
MVDQPNVAKHTFKEGVTEFWDWYEQVAQRFYETIESGQCESLTNETVDFMEIHLPAMSWVFGPGENGGHSFTLSGEGVLPKQLLAQYWQSRAKEIPGWTFYGSRQSCSVDDLKSMAIAVTDQEQVDSETFLIQTDVDDEEQLIDIVAWHPALAIVPQEHHYQILFLLLDEALGEFGTQNWLGEIKIQPIDEGVETRPLVQLPEFIEQVNRYHKWEKLPPLETFTLYRIEEQREGPRGDTIVGTSVIPNVIGKYIHHQGKLPEDPLEGTGARLAYLSIDGDVFPEGQQSDVRGNIEDALDEALEKEQSGRTLGGAFGTEMAYIDLLLVDGDNSADIVRQTLKRIQLDGKSNLHYFA